LIATAVVLVAGFSLGGAVLVSRMAGTTPVLVAAHDIPAGRVLGAGDVRSIGVAGPVRAIVTGDLATVIGQTTSVPLVSGQVLNRAMLTAAAVPGPGQSMIGLSLGPGQLPGDGLAAGDRVQAVAIPADAGGAADAGTDDAVKVLATGAVYAVRDAAGGDTLVTLLVDAEVAPKLVARGAAGRIGLVKISISPAAATAPAVNR
jgi:hypothetical protein